MPEIQVVVVYALPEKQYLMPITLPIGSTVIHAIQSSGILEIRPEIDISTHRFGIFSRTVNLQDKLQTGDRVEIYRPLLADPKELRRRRAERAATKKRDPAN